MSILFWLLWLLNAGLAIVIMYANSFRSGGGTGFDLDKLVLITIGVVLLTSVIVRYALKKPQLSLWIIGVPVVFFILWYVFEKAQKALR